MICKPHIRTAFARVLMGVVVATAALGPQVLSATQMTLAVCREKAAKGDAEAEWQLGQRYENGDGLNKDMLKAIVQYRKAAAQKHQKACEKMSKLHSTGNGVKKDAALAAKYAAWARGENGDIAVAKVREEEEKANIDEIELALDQLLGRNGKEKNPQKGVRYLHSIAKDNLAAQRVFVKRWAKGDLDEALSVLTDEEWGLVIPWFENAWKHGFAPAGQILGNDAYRKGWWHAALNYWKGSGLAKCWYFVGLFYDPSSKFKEGGGPNDMRDEKKAIAAYEKCLEIDLKYEDARYDLGLIYLFPKNEKIRNVSKALAHFKVLLRMNKENKVYHFSYGLAGSIMIRLKHEKALSALEARYKTCEEEYAKQERRVKDINSVRNETGGLQGYGSYGVSSLVSRSLSEQGKLTAIKNTMNRIEDDYKRELARMEKEQKPYLEHIQKAAEMGYEPARDFLKAVK